MAPSFSLIFQKQLRKMMTSIQQIVTLLFFALSSVIFAEQSKQDKKFDFKPKLETNSTADLNILPKDPPEIEKPYQIESNPSWEWQQKMNKLINSNKPSGELLQHRKSQPTPE